MSSDDNKQLMQTLDDSWNAQDWATFEARHAADTAVYWPGQPEPTRGVETIAKNPRRSSRSSRTNWTTGRTGCSSRMVTGPARSPAGQAR